jgi:uncharacterized membrane protein (UPF0127 family)
VVAGAERDVLSVRAVETDADRMGEVSFPIDVIFFRRGCVAKIVRSLLPGDKGVYTSPRNECSGVLEVAGGWVSRYGVRFDVPLFVAL